MTTIRRTTALEEDEASLEPHHTGDPLATARLRGGWLAGRSLLWMLPAAAALAGLVVFVLEPAETTGETKSTVAEALVNEGPTTTGSFSSVPSRNAPERGLAEKGPLRADLAPQPPAASAAPTGERALVQAAPSDMPETTASLASPAPPRAQAPEPSRAAALPPAASRTRTVNPSGEGTAADTGRRSPQEKPLKLSAEEVAAHLARGEERLRAGELAAARLYFERVAFAGDQRGAEGMARTYDPTVLAGLPILGPQANPAAAKTWYERAATQRAGR